MTALVLYDDAQARSFEPFALTRPISELRAGALLTRQRWERASGEAAAGFLGASHLSDFDDPDAPHALAAIPRGALVGNARFAPALDTRPSPGAARYVSGGRTVAVRVDAEIAAGEMRDGARPLDELPVARGETVELRGWWLDEVWSYVGLLSHMLASDTAVLGAEMRRVGKDETTIVGDNALYVEEGVTIEPHACFETTSGAVVLRRQATVQAFTRVVGPCYVGEASLVTTDRVSGSAIGPHCKVHGEMSSTVMLGYANKGHAGFVGHSYLGEWTNLGAGTTTSNLKNTYGPVRVWSPRGMRDTGLQYLGSLVGDHARTGINLSLTTGTVVGAGANVFGRMPPKVVPPFAWGEAGHFATYDVEKFIEVAARVMARRAVALSERERQHLAAAHGARWTA